MLCERIYRWYVPHSYHTPKDPDVLYTIHWNALPDTHNHYSYAHDVSARYFFFSLFRSIFFIFFTGTNLFFLLSSSSTVRQDGKSYFIGSVHIINIQKFMCVFVTDKTILCYTCLHHICIPVTVMQQYH